MVVGAYMYIDSNKETEEDPIEDVLPNDGPNVKPGDNDDVWIEQHSFTFVGTMNNWNVANQDYKMTSNQDYTYTGILECTDGILEFKIVDFKSWNGSYNSAYVTTKANYLDLTGDNIKIIGDGLYQVDLDIQYKTIKIKLLEKYEYVERYSLSLVGQMNEWDVENQDYLMESNGDYTYSYILSVEDNIEFKVVENCNATINDVQQKISEQQLILTLKNDVKEGNEKLNTIFAKKILFFRIFF